MVLYRIRFCDNNPERAKIREFNQFNQGAMKNNHEL